MSAPALPVITPVLSVRDLHVSYNGIPAVTGYSVDLAAGTLTVMLGRNGAGKTTAVRILATIVEPDAGQASVLGLDVVRKAGEVRAVIGLAGQYAAVDENLTGRENLRLIGQLTHQPRSAIAARAEQLLDRFGLVTAAGRPVRTYSGDMRRRLDLAAALVHRPPVLFLDEPTTGLDPCLHTNVAALLAATGVLLLFGFAISWVTALLGLVAKSAEAAAAASLPLTVLLAFPSSAFLLTKNMPGPLRAYADHQPLTAAVNAIRPLLLGGPTASHAVAAIIWCAGIIAVFAPLSVLRYRRAA